MVNTPLSSFFDFVKKSYLALSLSPCFFGVSPLLLQICHVIEKSDKKVQLITQIEFITQIYGRVCVCGALN